MCCVVFQNPQLGPKNPFLISWLMLSKNNLMLSPTARRLDSRLADEECVLATEKTTPCNPPQQNLYFVCVPHTVCHYWRNFAAESSATDFSLCQAWSSRVCQYQPWSTMISPLKSGSISAVLDNIFSGVVTNTSWSAIVVSFRWPF